MGYRELVPHQMLNNQPDDFAKFLALGILF